jgi:hypothetical protein
MYLAPELIASRTTKAFNTPAKSYILLPETETFGRPNMRNRKLGYTNLGLTGVGLGTRAIVGARRPEQIRETAPAAEIDLSEGDICKIEQIPAEREQRINPI